MTEFKYYPQQMTREQINAEIDHVLDLNNRDLDTMIDRFDELMIKSYYLPTSVSTFNIESDTWTVVKSLASYRICKNYELVYESKIPLKFMAAHIPSNRLTVLLDSIGYPNKIYEIICGTYGDKYDRYDIIGYRLDFMVDVYDERMVGI
jgi:hypothetical protein